VEQTGNVESHPGNIVKRTENLGWDVKNVVE
jgi:hypothetical protein